jgi:hypothetical protein
MRVFREENSLRMSMLSHVKAAWESMSTTGRVFLVLALLGTLGMMWRGSQGEWNQVVGQAIVTALFASLPARQLLRR